MGDYRPERLKEFVPKHEFFIGIDSDGCVFDTMEIKQKECFTPVTINLWNLQAVSKYAREAIEFVNLYSKWRGCNRFNALVLELDLLAQRPEVVKRGFKVPDLTPIKAWVDAGGTLSHGTLKEIMAQTGHPVFHQALAWTDAINRRVAEMVHGVPPFPGVRQSLEKITRVADIIVVSQTPGEALAREWLEHKIEHYPAFIAGQEMGSKTEHLKLAAGGKYQSNRVLMLGDALGDLKAARSAGALFFPINPGREEESWERLYSEGIDRFLADKFAGAYEEGLITDFEILLPETPPWKR